MISHNSANSDNDMLLVFFAIQVSIPWGFYTAIMQRKTRMKAKSCQTSVVVQNPAGKKCQGL